MTEFYVPIAMNIRVYGSVRIEADNLEAAKAKLTARYVADNFEPHGSGSDDYDMTEPTEIWAELIRDESTDIEHDLFLDLPEGDWVYTEPKKETPNV